MVRAPNTVFHHGWPRVRDWPIWTESKPLVALLLAVACGYLGWIAFYARHFHFHPANLVLFAALLACVAFSVEMSRRSSEPDGVVKDVYAVWELPMVFLLPGLYALMVPAIRLTLSQWRVRKVPVYRRVYTAATIGIGYGCARFIFMSVIPDDIKPRYYLFGHTTMWLAAAGAGALAQWAINQALIGSAFKLANPHARIRGELFGRESLHNDATELCAALLVTVGLTISALTLIIALPLATLLQRSFRHARLLSEAREDSKTGLLNAATWEREASAEIARAVRTSSPLAVALLDLDRFKQINDTHGHLIGDEVLRHVAETMTGLLREYDLAGRFGGEEFVMLLPQTRAPDAFKIADRVRAHIARMPIFTAGGEPVSVTVSIGVAALDAGSSRALTELLAAADAALYRAKASGRNQVQMISTSRGLSAVRSPVDDEPVPAAADGAFRGPGALPPDTVLDDGKLGLDGEFGDDEFDEEFAGEEFTGGEFAGEEFQVPDEGTASTATTSAFAV